MSALPDDFWMHDEATQTLTGRRTNFVFRLAQEVEVRLAEASPITGGLRFDILQGMPRGQVRGGQVRGGAPASALKPNGGGRPRRT
jgi:ribonuclease R